ncbi:MAG: lipase [Leptospiraceae bacterium]|nr:lipase [Leptospiraceae bacterium]MCP5501739.1 lipase [Leptospiraceae bacterium]
MKTLLTIVLAALLTTAVSASGGGSTKPLAGSYPIVLSHGILGFDDTQGLMNGLVKYWGGMDDYLREQGAAVLTPGKTAMQGLPYRAQEQKEQILVWMAANNYSKVHIIGHSQGGLDSRYMISNLGISNKISTLTTLNSVHRGSPVADFVLDVLPDWIEPFVGSILNEFGKLIYGGGEQDVIAMGVSLSTDTLAVFNQTTPNVSNVKYFSYGSKINVLPTIIQHPIMFVLYPITWAGGVFNGQGGDNDGVVPYSSQKWGTWKGGPSIPITTNGVDHLQATNFEWTGQLWYDVEGYYLKMAQNAKANQ